MKPLEHVVARIRATPREEQPYPHLVVDDVFPEDYYRRLLDMRPRKAVMFDTAPHVHQVDLRADPGVERGADGKWELEQLAASGALEADRVVFWKELRDALLPRGGGALVEALQDAFVDVLDTRGEDLYTVGRIAVDERDAGLGPHADRWDKRFSLLFYLAGPEHDSDAAREGCATRLLRCRSELDADDRRHHDYDAFDVVRTAQHVPNRLVVWAVTPDSYHAYHQTYGGDRWSLKVFVQERVDPSLIRARIAATKAHAEAWRATPP